MNRRTLVIALAMLAAACTGGGDPPDPTGTSLPSSTCPSFAQGTGPDCDRVEVRGAHYDVACVPVPSSLLDVPLAARWGGAKVRAIAAIAVDHGVAVLAGDGAGECGEWALATREGLATELVASVTQELRDAEDLPLDPGGETGEGE